MGRPKTNAFSGMHLVPVKIAVGLCRPELLGVLCLIGMMEILGHPRFSMCPVAIQNI
jgi:hypothetical protein